MRRGTLPILLLASHSTQSLAWQGSQTAFVPQFQFPSSKSDSGSRAHAHAWFRGDSRASSSRNNRRRLGLFLQHKSTNASALDASVAKSKTLSKRVGKRVKRSKGHLHHVRDVNNADPSIDTDTSTATNEAVRVNLKDLIAASSSSSNVPTLKGSESSDDVSLKERLARAAAALLAERKQEEAELNIKKAKSKRLSFSSMSAAKAARIKQQNPSLWASSSSSSSPSIKNKPNDATSTRNDSSPTATTTGSPSNSSPTNSNLLQLMSKMDQQIQKNEWSRTTQRPRQFQSNNNNNNFYDNRIQTRALHSTDSIQNLLTHNYNSAGGEYNNNVNSTTYHVAIVFGKSLIMDMVTVEYATRIKTLVKLLKEESFHPKLICFTGGQTQGNSISDAAAGYIYFRHLCSAQNVTIDTSTKIYVDAKSSNEREAMERIASELWRHHIKVWLSERPLVERLNQHYGVGWKILERKVDIHFTLISTEYHLCNLNDVHHRSPLKSFLQPLVSLRGLAGSDRWENNQELEVMDPNYSTSVHVGKRGSGGDGGTKSHRQSGMQSTTERVTFGGIENSVDTSWSFQYGTYPFLREKDEAIVFLGQCFLLGEELTPLLVNMKGVVEQTEFFQRDNYYLLSSIRRSLVSLVETLYTEKGQYIRTGVINHFQKQDRNRFTGEDVKILVVLESALLNLGRCIDLVKPAGLLVSSVPANAWSRALDALQKSMSHIQTVCDPDQPLESREWGKLYDDNVDDNDDEVEIDDLPLSQ